MTPKEKVAYAKIQLYLKHSFFGVLLFRMILVPSDTVKQLRVSGRYIKYNKEYIEKLGLEEVQFLIIQSVMHIVLMHHMRRNGREQLRWDIACDIAVNLLMKNSKISVPNWAVMEEKFENMSVEHIYEQIKIEKMDASNLTEIEDFDSEEGDEDEEKSQIKEMISEAMTSGRQQGDIPGDIEIALGYILQPKIPWKEKLARFMTQVARDDYSFVKKNRRYEELIVPYLHSLQLAEIIMFVDTSGSVDEDMLREFISEVCGILRMFKKSLTIIYCDAEISEDSVQTIDPYNEEEIKPVGRGGTDFRPPFKYVEDQKLDVECALYFTDGECDRFPKPPDYPVMWVLPYDERRFDPPFGEVLAIN